MSGQPDGLAGVIARLKQDGVQAAEKSKQEVLSRAQIRAKTIIGEAEQKAAQIKEEAEAQIEASKKEFAVELKMAARDFLMQFERSFREQMVIPEIKTGIGATLSGAESLAGCLESAVSAFVKAQGQIPSVLLSNELKAVLSPAIMASFQEKYSNGTRLEVRLSDDVDAFQLISQNGQFSWDFSTEALARALAKLVEPKFSSSLQPVLSARTQPQAN